MLGSTLLRQGPFVAVDIETTGSRPGVHSIIEIGAVRIEDGRIVSRFERLVSPTDDVPSAIETLTGITRDVLRGAAPIAGVLPGFRDFADGAVLIAHNHRFDLGFLDFEAELLWGRPFPRPVLDTLALANRLHPEEDRHNLKDLAARYGASAEPTHRALPDADATAEVFLAMLPELSVRGLETALDVARWCGMASQSALASVLPLTTSLPDARGVYIFRDATGRVIHVGRAKNLRVKVRSYFYATGGGGRHSDIGRRVASVGWLRCASDLDGLLLESRLVTRYRPPHNALVLRGDRGGWSLHADTGVRFPGVKVVARPPRRGIAIGPFTNRAAVEVVAEQLRADFGLRRCARRLTESLSSRPCEFREAGTCPRPCVTKLDPEAYDASLARALEVFDGTGDRWKADLERRMEKAAKSRAYEDAIRYRDAIRALDRSLAAMRTVQRATEPLGLALIEASDTQLAVHLVRRGYLLRTLRFAPTEPSAQIRRRLRRVMSRGYAPDAGPDDPARFTPRQLKDLFVIDSYRSQHAPLEVEISGDLTADVAAIMRFLTRTSRRPRRARAAPSDAARSPHPSAGDLPASP